MKQIKVELLTVMAKAALAMDSMPAGTDIASVYIGYNYVAHRLYAEITIDDFNGSAVRALAKTMDVRDVRELKSAHSYERVTTYETFFFFPDSAVRITTYPYRKGGQAL